VAQARTRAVESATKNAGKERPKRSTSAGPPSHQAQGVKAVVTGQGAVQVVGELVSGEPAGAGGGLVVVMLWLGWVEEHEHWRKIDRDLTEVLGADRRHLLPTPGGGSLLTRPIQPNGGC